MNNGYGYIYNMNNTTWMVKPSSRSCAYLDLIFLHWPQNAVRWPGSLRDANRFCFKSFSNCSMKEALKHFDVAKQHLNKFQHRKMYLMTCTHRRLRSACTSNQSDQSPRAVWKAMAILSDCADARSDLSPRFAHMSWDAFIQMSVQMHLATC